MYFIAHHISTCNHEKVFNGYWSLVDLVLSLQKNAKWMSFCSTILIYLKLTCKQDRIQIYCTSLYISVTTAECTIGHPSRQKLLQKRKIFQFRYRQFLYFLLCHKRLIWHSFVPYSIFHLLSACKGFNVGARLQISLFECSSNSRLVKWGRLADVHILYKSGLPFWKFTTVWNKHQRHNHCCDQPFSTIILLGLTSYKLLGTSHIGIYRIFISLTWP